MYANVTYFPTLDNPADDPTRDVPVRAPTEAAPAWLDQAFQGCFTLLDDFLEERGLHPTQLAEVPAEAAGVRWVVEVEEARRDRRRRWWKEKFVCPRGAGHNGGQGKNNGEGLPREGRKGRGAPGSRSRRCSKAGTSSSHEDDEEQTPNEEPEFRRHPGYISPGTEKTKCNQKMRSSEDDQTPAAALPTEEPKRVAGKGKRQSEEERGAGQTPAAAAPADNMMRGRGQTPAAAAPTEDLAAEATTEEAEERRKGPLP